jgi:hypothetical protein
VWAGAGGAVAGSLRRRQVRYYVAFAAASRSVSRHSGVLRWPLDSYTYQHARRAGRCQRPAYRGHQVFRSRRPSPGRPAGKQSDRPDVAVPVWPGPAVLVVVVMRLPGPRRPRSPSSEPARRSPPNEMIRVRSSF